MVWLSTNIDCSGKSESDDDKDNNNYGHRVMELQENGVKLYRYRRKNGGIAIGIPAKYLKQSDNESIKTGKEFDKETALNKQDCNDQKAEEIDGEDTDQDENTVNAGKSE